MFRAAFVYDDDRVERVMPLDERDAIRDRRLLVAVRVVLSPGDRGFVAHGALDLEPSVVALLGAGRWSPSPAPSREYLDGRRVAHPGRSSRACS